MKDAAEQLQQLWSCPDGTTCYLSWCSRSSTRIRALLCRGVALLRLWTLRQTWRQRARLKAWEPASANAGQTLQVSEHTNTLASVGDSSGWLELSAALQLSGCFPWCTAALSGGCLCRTSHKSFSVWFGFSRGGFAATSGLKPETTWTKCDETTWTNKKGLSLLIQLPRDHRVFSCWIIIISWTKLASQTQRSPWEQPVFICIQIFPVNLRSEEKRPASTAPVKLIRFCFYL